VGERKKRKFFYQTTIGKALIKIALGGRVAAKNPWLRAPQLMSFLCYKFKHIYLLYVLKVID
jgi:hypothetical protein